MVHQGVCQRLYWKQGKQNLKAGEENVLNLLLLQSFADMCYCRLHLPQRAFGMLLTSYSNDKATVCHKPSLSRNLNLNVSFVPYCVGT